MATGTFVFSDQIARAPIADVRTGTLPGNGLWYFNFQNLASQLANLQAVANNAFGTNVFALADQPSLGVSDAGYVGFVSDYAHLVYWNGTAWIFLDGVGGYFTPFALAPGTGWAACDGSSVNILQVGATLTTTAVTTPNLNGSAAYVKSAATYSSTINAASGTTADGSTGTGTTGTGTTGTGTTGTGTTGTGSFTGQPTATVTVQSGSGATVAGQTHTHPIPALSVPGLSVPGLSVPGLSIPSLTVAGLAVGTIDMAHVGAPFYVRQ
jgi:hypothetical protein